MAVRGRRERELEPQVPLEGGLGVTVRAWRRFRGLTVTELAVQAGFGKNGRGYISKIEHQQIKRLGEEQIDAIAQALGLTQIDLQQQRMPEMPESLGPDNGILDEAIVGCRAWLRVYHYRGGKRLDYARTLLKLAQLCWDRIALAKGREERILFLTEALHSLDQALPIFQEEAPGSYENAQHLRSVVDREIYREDMDDAIAGCKVLLKVHSQEEQPLDWARTHAQLAQLYWDRATQLEKADERHGWLEKALTSIDQALPIFSRYAPVSYIEAQRMRGDVESAREDHLEIEQGDQEGATDQIQMHPETEI